MAFVPMFIMAILIVGLIILGFIILCLIVGSGILIVGLLNRKTSKKKGVSYSKKPIIIGGVIMGLPLILALGITVFLNVRTAILRLGYENCVDKWICENVTSEEAQEDIIKEFFEAADNKDKEKIIALFSGKIKASPDLEKQVELFLEEYPGGLAGLDFKGGGEPDNWDFDATYEVNKDGKYYYITFNGRFRENNDEDEVGLEYFEINSEKGVALSYQYDGPVKEYKTKEGYIVSNIEVEEDIIVRRVAGIPFVYEQTVGRHTKEKVLGAINNSNTADDLYEVLGEPNGHIEGYVNTLIYEVESEGSDYQYVLISYDFEKYTPVLRKNDVIVAGTEKNSVVSIGENKK